jgi:hypothetical protein
MPPARSHGQVDGTVPSAEIPHANHPMKTMIVFRPIAVAMALALGGCTTIPHEVIRLHEKEAEIVSELQRTHLALVDSYVDQRLSQFEAFYFTQYGPKFFDNWKAGFARTYEREYDPAKDFNLLHQDLVAEYLETVKPVEELRLKLRSAIQEAYSQFFEAQGVVQAWLVSARKWNETQRTLTNKLLGSIDSSLSLETIDQEIKRIETRLGSPP